MSQCKNRTMALTREQEELQMLAALGASLRERREMAEEDLARRASFRKAGKQTSTLTRLPGQTLERIFDFVFDKVYRYPRNFRGRTITRAPFPHALLISKATYPEARRALFWNSSLSFDARSIFLYGRKWNVQVMGHSLRHVHIGVNVMEFEALDRCLGHMGALQTLSLDCEPMLSLQTLFRPDLKVVNTRDLPFWDDGGFVVVNNRDRKFWNDGGFVADLDRCMKIVFSKLASGVPWADFRIFWLPVEPESKLSFRQWDTKAVMASPQRQWLLAQLQTRKTYRLLINNVRIEVEDKAGYITHDWRGTWDSTAQNWSEVHQYRPVQRSYWRESQERLAYAEYLADNRA